MSHFEKTEVPAGSYTLPSMNVGSGYYGYYQMDSRKIASFYFPSSGSYFYQYKISNGIDTEYSSTFTLNDTTATTYSSASGGARLGSNASGYNFLYFQVFRYA